MGLVEARDDAARRFAGVSLLLSATVVAFLVWLVYFHEGDGSGSGSILLPALSAVFNSLAALCLTAGLVAIRRRKRELHRALMFAALAASAMFLINYVVYHYTKGDTPFRGTGWIRPVYFTVLISHIVLSVVVLPMILWTLFLALTGRFGAHRKLAPFTWWTWMYVSVTGVVVFLMLHVL